MPRNKNYYRVIKSRKIFAGKRLVLRGVVEWSEEWSVSEYRFSVVLNEPPTIAFHSDTTLKYFENILEALVYFEKKLKELKTKYYGTNG